MKKAEPLQWPPVIEFTRARWHVRFRDIFLTFFAWAVIVYLVWDGLVLVFDYFSYPIFQLTKAAPPDWVRMWHGLNIFLGVAAANMAWIFVWGYLRRRRLRRAARVTPPPPLALEEHAATFGLQPDDVEQWRDLRIVVVEFDAGSRVTRIAQLDGTSIGGATHASDGTSTTLLSP